MLLLLHELGGSKDSRVQWLDPLLTDRLRRVLIDLPGAGESMSFDDIADALTGLVDDLGFARVNVFGTTFGAWSATYLAARHPDCVNSLMLAAIAPQID